GKRLATRGKDNRIGILDLDTGQTIRTLAPPEGGQESGKFFLAPRGFTPDGQSLVVQGEAVSVWDVRTGKQKTSSSLSQNKLLDKPAKPQRHSWERIESVALSPDGKTIAFALLKDRPDQP